ncbi:fasciculation and elongation protein zeta-2-like [Acropora millepora]|uniref:fasciculation and elongation protein zeta-2-like n=1 Tax=Acropora millepora TaxID=45264 RepID=UPI001CF58A70|nr:fasciculation and elongation protein zeta-2-like [Acropora millepora]
MAGTEDPSSPDEDSEWSDFSSNSSKLNAFDNLPFGTKSLDPISVLSTLIACFPLPSDSTGESSASVADDRILDRVDPSLESYGDPFLWRGSESEMKYFSALKLASCNCQNRLPPWQVEEDTQFVSKKTFDFHKFAEKFKANSVSQQWNTDSNDLAEDFVPSQSPNPHSSTADSDSENEDEIFLVFRGKPNSRVSSFDECQAASGLSELSNGELFDLKQEMAAYVKEYSDVLIEELTLREELEREKEVKNKFISTLLAVQSKIRDFQSGQGRSKKGSSANSAKYLTTVIPYDDFDGGPSTKVLQQLIEIMEALITDSPIVPGLITEYILKVLCAED